MAGRCYEHLRPGGVFIVGNFGGENPNRAFMDNLLHWNLIHRDEGELKTLFAKYPVRRTGVTVLAEPNRVNLFAVAEKKLTAWSGRRFSELISTYIVIILFFFLEIMSEHEEDRVVHIHEITNPELARRFQKDQEWPAARPGDRNSAHGRFPGAVVRD